MSTQTKHPSHAMLVAAFAAIYLVWGSTYLAIRVAVETMPPFLLSAARFLFAGLSLLGLLWFKGVPMPTRSQWRSAVIAGSFMLVGGNGLVVWAEQTVTSSLTALIIATTPAWFALLEWLRPNGTRPKLQTIIGIAIGFAGVSLLINLRGGSAASGESIHLPGTLAVIIATASWAGGSLYAKHSPKPESPWMNVAIQMIGGGGGLLLVALLLGEPARADWSRVSAASLWAFAYLVVFGSWIAFSAFVWLLKNTTPARLSTYAYVNPVIAVFLGWLILHEPVTVRTLWAAAVILTGVIIITLPSSVTDLLRRRNTLGPIADK
jgi:drug/metabolite transporter (DMT)-like permease